MNKLIIFILGILITGLVFTVADIFINNSFDNIGIESNMYEDVKVECGNDFNCYASIGKVFIELREGENKTIVTDTIILIEESVD